MSLPAQLPERRRGQVIGTGLVTLDRIYVGTPQPAFEELGGSCGNVLISLAMLGWSVMPLLRLGNDPVGTRLERDLRLAGADTRLVARRQDVSSPIIFELLDPISKNHRFSFACPHSSETFGEFQSITPYELAPARAVVASCTIFYTDRLSETICDAMETAAGGGAIVYFEPSSVVEPELFERAVAIAHILKYSVERLSPEIASLLRPDAYSIVTKAHSGLELRHRGRIYRCPAFPVDVVTDTCGSGDMVTLGLIDAILQSHVSGFPSLSSDEVLAGVRVGQQLAAANCAYVGARGLFRERGAEYARSILADAHSMVRQRA